MDIGPMGELSVALRALARRPAFGTCTAAVLAVGIAAVSTMFSALNGVVLRPLPYHCPEQLVWVYSGSEASPRNSTSALDYFDYRRQFKAFESVAAQLVFRPIVYVSGDGEPEPLRFTDVSANYFATLGVRPALGRGFVAAEEEASAANVVILSHGLWQRRLAGRADAVGQTLTLDGASCEVVGVMPAGVTFPSEVDLWRPMRKGQLTTDGRGNNNFSLFGRLRAGVSMEAAQAEASVLARQLEQAYPENKGWGLLLVPMHEVFFGDYRPALVRLMAAVLLLLLITCANVSSLFLARAVSRKGELAVRLALGASRARLVWHVLAESLLVAVVGGTGGLALTWGAIRGLRALAPAGIPRVNEIAIDATVTAVTAGACMLAGLVAGLLPALRGSRVAPAEAMSHNTRVVSNRGGAALRSGLVVVQVALSLVLLIGSSLLVKSFLALQGTEVGFSASNLLIADVRPPAAVLEDSHKRARFYRDLTDRLRGTPGIRDVALAEQLPFLAGGTWNKVFAGDWPAPAPEDQVGAERRRVGDGHFKALGIGVLQGREIRPSDTIGQPPVVVINKALADRVWPNQSALGRTLGTPVGSRRADGGGGHRGQHPGIRSRCGFTANLLSAARPTARQGHPGWCSDGRRTDGRGQPGQAGSQGGGPDGRHLHVPDHGHAVRDAHRLAAISNCAPRGLRPGVAGACRHWPLQPFDVPGGSTRARSRPQAGAWRAAHRRRLADPAPRLGPCRHGPCGRFGGLAGPVRSDAKHAVPCVAHRLLGVRRGFGRARSCRLGGVHSARLARCPHGPGRCPSPGVDIALRREWDSSAADPGSCVKSLRGRIAVTIPTACTCFRRGSTQGKREKDAV